MFENNKKFPFPKEMKGDASNGTHCAIQEKNEKIRYLVIRVKKYMPENVGRRIKEGRYSVEEIYPEVVTLGYIPLREKTFWLHHLQTYIVDDILYETFDDLFHAENVSHYESVVFDDIDAVLQYCVKRFGIEPDGFHGKFDNVELI